MKRTVLAVAIAAIMTAGLATAAEASLPPLRMALASGQPCQGYVALTYDDGPTDVTLALSRALAENGMAATFFVTGEHAREFPDVLKALVADGDEIGNHTLNHPYLTDLTLSTVGYQLIETTNAIRSATGMEPHFYRPPYGATNPEIKEVAVGKGMAEVIWSVDTNDWQGKTPEEVAGVVGSAQDGAVVLMHDDSPDDVTAVPLIAAALEAEGLCAGGLVTSDDAVEAWEGLTYNVKAGPWGDRHT